MECLLGQVVAARVPQIAPFFNAILIIICEKVVRVIKYFIINVIFYESFLASILFVLLIL